MFPFETLTQLTSQHNTRFINRMKAHSALLFVYLLLLLLHLFNGFFPHHPG